MGLLQGLLGSQREEFDDFVNRYDQGAPWDGISQEEAVSRYQQVATQVPPDVYEQSAEEAFSRLSPLDPRTCIVPPTPAWLQAEEGYDFGCD